MENTNRAKYQKIVHKPALFLRATVRKLVPESVRPNISTIAKYLCIGLAIRFFLMPITLLVFDSISVYFTAWVAEHYGMYDFFLYYPLAYPPLVTYIPAFFFRIYEIFFPGFFFQKHVVFAPEGYPTLYYNFPYANYTAYQTLMSDPQVFPFLFLAKLPSLIFDLGIAFLLLRIFKDPSKSLLAFKVWILNPVTIFTIYMMGEIEIIPLFFAVFGTYLMYKDKPKIGILSLGLAAAMKPLALLLVPLACIVLGKNKTTKRTIKLFLIALIPLVVELVVWQTVSTLHQGFQLIVYEDNLLGYPRSAQLTNWLRFGVDYSARVYTYEQFIDVIYLFPLFYAMVLSLTIFSKKIDRSKLWHLFTCIFCLLFALNLFHSHWFLWCTPFMIVFFVMADGKKLLRLFLLINLFYIFYTFYTWELQFALFMPITPSIYQQPGAITLLNNLGVPGIQVVNLARSAFSGFLLFSGALSLKHVYLGNQSISDLIRVPKTRGGDE